MGLTDAIILVGGKGTRLRSVTNNEIPKPLVKIQNKPILCWELDLLIKEGFSKAILAVGHLGNVIEQEMGNSYSNDHGQIDIKYSYEEEKVGSGGAVKLASRYVTGEQVLVMNGDILTSANLEPMIALHNELKVKGTMLGVNMTSPYGIVHHENNLITKFEEKPRLDVPIHAGIDIFDSSILPRFPDKGQMEETIFLELVKEKQFAFYLLSNDVFWMSIDTQKDYDAANSLWKGL